MPLNTGIEDSDNRKLTRTLDWGELGTRLLTFTADRVLPLISRSVTAVPMPPLAFHIWQQLDYLKEKGSRLTGWATDYAGVILPRSVRLPILMPSIIPALGKPVTHSPAWWQLLHLVWLRQRRRRKNDSLYRVPVADEGQSYDDTNRNTWVDEPYSNELLQTLKATEKEPLVNAADEPYPMVIKNVFSPPLSGTGLHGFFPQIHATSEYLPAGQVAKRLGAEAISRSAAPYVSRSKIYEAVQIQRPSYLHVKNAENRLAQAKWRPQLAYRSQRVDKV